MSKSIRKCNNLRSPMWI